MGMMCMDCGEANPGENRRNNLIIAKLSPMYAKSAISSSTPHPSLSAHLYQPTSISPPHHNPSLHHTMYTKFPLPQETHHILIIPPTNYYPSLHPPLTTPQPPHTTPHLTSPHHSSSFFPMLVNRTSTIYKLHIEADMYMN